MPAAAALERRPTPGHAMLTVGDTFPGFRLPALAPSVGRPWEFESAWLRGRWAALLYFPDPSGLAAAEDVADLVRLRPAFAARETQFLVACASAGDQGPRPEARRFASDFPFPVLLDAAGELARGLGLPVAAGGPSVRTTFVADPSGTVRWMAVSTLDPGRVLHDAVHAMEGLRGASSGPSGAANPRRLVRACAWCQRLQDEGGWHTAERYIARRLAAGITHGICVDCLKKQSTA